MGRREAYDGPPKWWTIDPLWKMDDLTKQLDGMITAIEEVLPAVVKGEASRFVKRAKLTLMTSKNAQFLTRCTKQSVAMGVIRGAELGLPIDERLAYLVPYWNKHIKAYEAQFMSSYVGLSLIAKRSGQIVDVVAKPVYEGDAFEHGRDGDQNILKHRPTQLGQERGELLGVYCVTYMPNHRWEYDVMHVDEIDAIRGRSKAGREGPWVSDYIPMALKTIIRRGVKLYCTDPGFVLACQIDEQEYVHDLAVKKARRSELNEQLGLPAPRQPTQFEKDMAAGSQQREAELVSKTNGQSHHAEKEMELPQGEQQQRTEPQGEAAEIDVDYDNLFNTLDQKLECALTRPEVEAAQEWARGYDPAPPVAVANQIDAMCEERIQEIEADKPKPKGKPEQKTAFNTSPQA